MRLMVLLIVWATIMFGSHGYAQIYSYKNQKGNVYYTDNPANIPENRHEDVKTMAEINLSPKQSLIMEEYGDEKSDQTQSFDSDEANKIVQENAIDDHLKTALESIALERSKIQELYDQIEKDKQKLIGSRPLPESLSVIEQRVYHQQILDLNQRIDHYQKRVEAYRLKLEAVNSIVHPN